MIYFNCQKLPKPFNLRKRLTLSKTRLWDRIHQLLRVCNYDVSIRNYWEFRFTLSKWFFCKYPVILYWIPHDWILYYRSKQMFKQESTVWNSAGKTIFRLNFDKLLEFQTEPILILCSLFYTRKYFKNYAKITFSGAIQTEHFLLYLLLPV